MNILHPISAGKEMCDWGGWGKRSNSHAEKKMGYANQRENKQSERNSLVNISLTSGEKPRSISTKAFLFVGG
jgi:hypothetical protein